MNKFTLTQSEISEIIELINTITNRFNSVTDQGFLIEVALYAQELPRRLRSLINDFRYHEEGDGCSIFSGFPVDQTEIGPTPAHWARSEGVEPTQVQEVFLMLCGALLGDAISFSTQQDGAIMHNILPMQRYEHSQLGFSSKEYLTWHNEDAFHDYRGDYLAMMCMRNQDKVPTVISSIANVSLDEEYVEVLFQPHFTILPDNSHRKVNNFKGQEAEKLAPAFDSIEQWIKEPPKIAVLFGDPKSPYIRLDPYFMATPENPLAARALASLTEQLEANLEDVALAEGEVILVDNFRAVHGRAPFQARYDGTDRWLKRINITRDLRKSRSAREMATTRQII